MNFSILSSLIATVYATRYSVAYWKYTEGPARTLPLLANYDEHYLSTTSGEDFTIEVGETADRVFMFNSEGEQGGFFQTGGASGMITFGLLGNRGDYNFSTDGVNLLYNGDVYSFVACGANETISLQVDGATPRNCILPKPVRIFLKEVSE